MTFKVQKKSCATCIYKPDCPLNVESLEEQIADGHGGYTTYRQCHHTNKNAACCRGFWNKHKDNFQLGQLAQRLDMVEFVNIDELGSNK